MWLANPIFLRQEPSQSVQLTVLLTLLWVALPLLWALPVGIIVLFGVLWLLRLGLWAYKVKAPSWPWLVLLLAVAVAVVWQQVGTIIGRDGGVAFLLLLTVLKAYEGRGLRDWQVLLLAMLMMMGGAVLFNQNVVMAVWLLMGLLLLTANMALLGGLALRDALRQSMQALILALPLAALLFVVVPRMAEPLWRMPQNPSSQASTGLSDTMRPGSISDLVQSNEPAFNAIFANGYVPPPQDLYWRVMVMADFDGSQWRAMDERYIDDARAVLAEAPAVDYQLIIRDEQGRIPALDYPIHIDDNSLSMRLGGVVRVNRSREGLRRVALQATFSPYLGQMLDEGERAYYTRLPTQVNPRTRALAHQLRSRSSNDKVLISQVLAYFRRQGFVYTLQPTRQHTADGTDYFLFEGREGFCEDYANAFVNVMRAAGVPARIVTGYLGGEYNRQGQFWQIRSKDAHAWAEVWLASENAWLRVDPTTAVVESRGNGGVVSALPPSQRATLMPQNDWLYRIGQSSRFYWQQWVVNFDADRQQTLFQRLGLGSVSVGSTSLLLLLGGVLASLPLLVWWLYQQRRNRRPLADGFMLLKSRVLDMDAGAQAAIGPLELQQLLAQQHLLTEPLQALLDDYIRYVYADEVLPSLTEQRRWYRRVKRVLSKIK